MANLLLTTNCNLRCAYCFAQERLSQRGSQMMSWPNIVKVVEFLKRSEHPLLRLMGGEPTLHPNFQDAVLLALTERMQVDVLSNATWPEKLNEFFDRIAPSAISFLLNIDHPDRYNNTVWEAIQRNVAAVAPGRNVTLSFNIFELQPRYEYILDLIERHRISRIRLSLSLPIAGAHNAHLTIDECKRMGPFVVRFSRECRAAGADVRMDNAAPLCMFSNEEMGELVLNRVIDPARNAKCDPIVDIGPDLSVWCCFCLSKLWNRKLDEFSNLQEIIAFYQERLAPYQGRLFPLDECATCRWREVWNCQGGCVSYTIERYGSDAVVAAQAAGIPAGPLALAPGVTIREHDYPRPCLSIARDGAAGTVEVNHSLKAVLGLVDGVRNADQIAAGFMPVPAPADDPDPIARFAAKAAADAVTQLLACMVRDGIVVQHPLAGGPR